MNLTHVLEITPSGSITHFSDGTSVTRLTRTPPVENSNPEGGPKGADGQGVCTTPCQCHLDGVSCACVNALYRVVTTFPPSLDLPEVLPCGTVDECVELVGILLKAGATTCTVEVVA